MISFIWMTTVSVKYGNIESIKILFEPSKRVAWWNLWIAQVKITHYIDDTERKTQINAAMRAAPSPAFHAISTKYEWRAIYNCRRTGCRQLNV